MASKKDTELKKLLKTVGRHAKSLNKNKDKIVSLQIKK